MRNVVLVVTMIVAMLMVCSVSRAEITIWGLSSGLDDLSNKITDVTLRGGYQYSQFEGGLESTWYPYDDTPETLGVYSCYFAKQLAIGETVPYAGGRISIDLQRGNDKQNSYFGPMGGLLINKYIVVEYQYTDYDGELGQYIRDEHRVTLGARIAF